MTHLLWRQNLRWLLQSPWQTLVPILGVALGVAAVVAIDLAKGSALESMRISQESVVGRATHIVTGGPGGLDESLYRALRVERGFRASAPIVTGSIQLSGRALVVLGIDPFADGQIRPVTTDASQFASGLNTILLTAPGGVLLAEELAKELMLDRGDRAEVLGAGRRHPIEVVGILQPADDLSRQALRDVVVCDIATAQVLLSMQGRLSRVDLILPGDPGDGDSQRELRDWLPTGAELLRATERAEAVERMTLAFRTNLTALSMLGLVVGVFLIYNSLTFSVVQRRTLFGRLKAIGVSRGEIFGLVIGEGALIGVIGGVIGLALGVYLAQVLVAAVSQTLSDLYAQSGSSPLVLSPLSLALGLALGILASLVAGFIPALEAMSSSAVQVLSRSNLERRARARVPWLACLGLVLLLTGAALTQVATRSLIAGLGVVGIVTIGFALMIPGASVLAIRGVQPLLSLLLGPLGTMACRGVTASLSRTGVALAALAVAISMTVGIDIMVGSFRDSVDRWLGASLAADLYITGASEVSAGGRQTALHPDLYERYAATEGVAHAGSNRTVSVSSAMGPIDVAALHINRKGFSAFPFRSESTDLSWRSFSEGDSVIVTEPLAYRLELEVGDLIPLETDRGLVSFLIGGVVRSYASDRGAVLMHRRSYDTHWEDPLVNAISLDLEDSADLETVIAALRMHTPDDAVVRIQSNRDLRNASLAVFDRTFAITRALRGIALLVAFAGILGALLALALERRREFAILRATGLLPRQVRALVMLQTGLLGTLAGVLALPLGLTIAWLLIHVINRRSFGWSMEMSIHSSSLWEAVAIALAASLLAGIYPALSMAHMNTADALREE